MARRPADARAAGFLQSERRHCRLRAGGLQFRPCRAASARFPMRLGDRAVVYFPVNGSPICMSATACRPANTVEEARAQALSEIYERHIPSSASSARARPARGAPAKSSPAIRASPRGSSELRARLRYPRGCLARRPLPGDERHPAASPGPGCFASFGAHPRFEIALERALTELLQGRALDALGGFPSRASTSTRSPARPTSRSIFVDSSGLVSWNFLGNEPDFDFVDWNFATTTAEDHAWLVDSIHASGHEIYVADFRASRRLRLPRSGAGHERDLPIDELEYENNSVANNLREAILYLPELDDDECADLLDAFERKRPRGRAPGRCADRPRRGRRSVLADLRVGELKDCWRLPSATTTRLSKAANGCGTSSRSTRGAARSLRCIECLLTLNDNDGYGTALEILYGPRPAHGQGLARGRSAVLRPACARYRPRWLRHAPALAGGLRETSQDPAGSMRTPH